jgi:hypothetical protein
VWALRFGTTRAELLPSPATALAMEAMGLDVNRGENWRDEVIAGRPVLVGNPDMVPQDGHKSGRPYVFLGAVPLYALITDDEAWAAEAIAGLPDDRRASSVSSGHLSI